MAPHVAGFDGDVFTLPVQDVRLEGIFLGNRSEARPLIIFIPGSEPVPLFCSIDGVYHPLFPHQLPERGRTFNILLLSKPGIPALTEQGQLDEDFLYRNKSTGAAPEVYLRKNTLEFYTDAYRALLNSLDTICPITSVTIIGHSQGARIVAELADHPVVSKVVYMSADPLGRLAAIRQTHGHRERSTLFNDLMNPSYSDSLYRGERYASYRSFAKPSITGLTKASVPVLMVYGDRDDSCPNCYILSILPAWYPNMQVLHYTGYDHNYFDAKGTNHWGEVVDGVLKWIGTE